jgi:hypothetical protein
VTPFALPDTTLRITDADRALMDCHLVDGLPTLPGSVMLELAVRRVLAAYSGLSVIAISDVRFGRYIRARADGRLPDVWVAAEARTGRTSDGSVTVGVTLGTTTLVGRVECARMFVDLGPEAPRIPAGARRTVPSGSASVDPYQQPGSPVRLRGPFTALVEPRGDHQHGVATFRVGASPMPQALKTFRLPVLALDCLVRTWAQAGGDLLPVAVPTGMARIDFFTGLNDVDINRRFGELTLVHQQQRAAGSLLEAIDPSGRPILRIRGLTMHELAWLRLRDGKWLRTNPNEQQATSQGLASSAW